MKTTLQDPGSNTEVDTQHQIGRYLRQAIDWFRQSLYEDAFQALANAKRLRAPVENIDYFRAACLLHLGRPIDAREALREELHYFPGNVHAAKLLEELLQKLPDAATIADPEFEELYPRIRPHTMLPEARLYSLFTLAKRACVENRPGHFVECGVARGGTTLMLGLIIEKYSEKGNKRPRHHFAFDSFSGMPDPSIYDTQNGVEAQATGWGAGTCAGSLETVQALCDDAGVGNRVTLVPGFFEDTLAAWTDRIGQISLLHLDADWYTSTLTVLTHFYPLVTPGGLLQFDDYDCWDGCRKAVDEFQLTHTLDFPLQAIEGDNQGVWMQKPG